MAAAESLTSIVSGTAPEPEQLPQRHVAALVRAEEDLEWRFRVADHANVRGAKGQGYEPGTSVFDEMASWRLHRSLHSFRQAKAVATMRRVDATMTRMAGDEQRDARAIYEPQKWRELLSRAMFVAESAQLPIAVITLVGLLPVCSEAIEAFTRGNGGHAPDSESRLLDWIEETIRPRLVNGQPRQFPPRWFFTARNWCESRRISVLRSYAEAGKGMRRELRDAARASNASLRTSLRIVPS
jgi:hypothetical protein